MKILKLNAHFEKYYTPKAKVLTLPLPDGSYFFNSGVREAYADLANDIADILQTETDVLDLPERGEQCVKDVVYKRSLTLEESDGGESPFVICQQTHNRTEHDIKDIPALFTFFRENSDDLEWIPNEKVDVKWKRIYNGVTYECIQAHMTLESWTPDNTPTLWKAESTGEVSEWKQPTGGHDAYSIGDRVTFNGSTYESVINANVWSPIVYGWVKV